MAFKIEITNFDTAAMADYPEEEVAGILRKIAEKLEEGHLIRPGYEWPVMDVNGARVGMWGTYED